MKLWRKSALIAPALIVVMTAAACGGGNDTGGGGGNNGGTKTGGRLVYGLDTAFPDNLMPLISAGNSISTGYTQIRVLLAPFRIYPDFTVRPDNDLVVGDPTTQMTNGKQVVTYKINPKAVWSDGQPITAKDFAFTWQIQKSADPASGGCAALLTTVGYDQIASVEGSDNDKTVTVTYAKPFSDWKSLFTLFPQHIMDKGSPKANCDYITAGWKPAEGMPASSGPYLMAKEGIDVNKKIMTLTRNPKWWGAPSKLDAIIVQVVGNDPSVSVSALRNNEVQMIYPQPQLDLVKQIKSLEPTVTSSTNFGLSFEHLDFNTKDELLGQKVVRQAIAYGLNRPDIVAKTVAQFDGRAQVLNNRYFVNNQPGYQDNSGGLYNKQDAGKAQSLLEGAGFAKGPDGIYQKGGKRLSFQLMTTQANPLRSNAIDVIAQQLKPVGIEIKKFLNPDIFAGKEKPKSLEGGQFQIAMFAWVSAPYISSNQSLYQSPQGDNIAQNYTRGGDPRVDKIFPEINSATDDKTQQDLGNQVDKLLWDDLYTIPLFQKPTFLAYNSKYTGFQENASLAGPLWDATKIALKQ